MAPEADCYEDIFSVMRKLNLPNEDFKQLFLIMAMNVLGGNVNDHNKNFSFTMDSTGRWHLAPAYDINFCIDPASPAYMNRHELSINGKKDGITKQDLIEIGKKQDIHNCPQLYEQVADSFTQFPELAANNGISNNIINMIQHVLRSHCQLQ